MSRRRPLIALLSLMGLLLVGVTWTGTANGGGMGTVNGDIQAVTLSGRLTNLSRNPASDASPAVSPDGKEIAFVSSRDGRPDIYLMTKSGGNVRRLTTSPLDTGGVSSGPSAVAGDGDTSISWSPNGRQLAFDAVNATVPSGCLENCTDWRVLVVNTDGSGLRLIADAARFPSWSPDGRRLAYYSGYSPAYGDYIGIAVTTLASGANVDIHAYNNGAASAPAWSPNGRLLAFDTNRADSPQSQVEIVSPRGGKPHKLGPGEEPAWSPDGRRLALVDNGRLFTVPVAGGASTRLSRPGEHLDSPTWSPDGRWIAFERLTLTKYTQLVTNTQLVVVGARSHIEHTLTREPPGTFFAGGPSWTDDSREIVIAADIRAGG